MFSQTIKRHRAIWSGAIVAALGAGAVLLHAFNPQPDPPKIFGIFGITPSDVIRVNVTNVGSAVGIPPGPCRAQIGFVNADGTALKSSGVTIADGHSASLMLNFVEASSAETTLALTRSRVSVRPVVNFVSPACFTAVSAEVEDAFTGRTNIYATPMNWAAAPAVSTNTPQ